MLVSSYLCFFRHCMGERLQAIMAWHGIEQVMAFGILHLDKETGSFWYTTITYKHCMLPAAKWSR